MLGWGLNIVVGLAGLLDLGYVAFYAVGAYSYALLATHFGWSFWTCLPLAGVFAAAAGVILGFPVLRLRGDYLAIVTLGFGEIIRLILLNWYDVTNGPDGISRIPRPSFFGLEFTRRPAEGEATPPLTVDLQLPDTRPYRLSRAHFAIRRHVRGYVVSDLGSVLGTAVNGKFLGHHFPIDAIDLKVGENAVAAGGARSPFAFRIVVEPA